MAKKKWYRFYLYLVLELVRWLFCLLPRRVGRSIGAGLGVLVYWILPRYREKTLMHLDDAFGREQSASELKGIARRVFIHLGKAVVDVCRFPKLTREEIEKLVCSSEGTAKLDQALARGKGAIALSGHIGNWELLGAYLRFQGYQGRAIGRRIYYDRFNLVLVSLRQGGLVSTIYRDESARLILSELKKNHVLGMLADQDIDSLEGIFVPFLGRQAWTSIAPAKISLASGSAIVPAFVVHEKGRYRLFMEDPIWPITDEPKERAVQKMTEAWSRVLEGYVRRFPEQWVWMHDRWKTPVPSGGESTEAEVSMAKFSV